MRHRLLVASLAVATAMTQVSSASAFFGLFGSRDADEVEVIGEPQNYTAEVTVLDAETALERKLRNSSTLWNDRDEPASGAGGLLAKARGDYRRLLAALYTEGRYGGTISIRIDGREAADIAPDTPLANPATVVVSIDPGPEFRFGEASIINEAPPPQSFRDEVDDPRDEGYAPGEVARSTAILRAERLSVEAWRQQGHAKAEIVERRVEAAHDADIVNARITLEPGRKAYYGPITVQGTERMDPEFVAFMAGLPLGREYDPDDIRRAGERLARLDVFRASRFQEADAIGPDGLLPIDLIVQERELRRFGIGGSYSTVDGLGFETYWLHRNLFGRAERLRFDARVAGIGRSLDRDGFDPRDFTYRVGVSFEKPGVFTPDTNYFASLFGTREVLDTYTRTGVDATSGFSHVFTEELAGRFAVNASHAEFEDDAFGTRQFTTAGLFGSLTFDSRDDVPNPTRGYFGEAMVEPFYEFQYGNAAFRSTLEGRTYYGFGQDSRFVLAGRAKVGTLVGPSIGETPPDKLFFAGGGGSVRGYAFRNIGVEGPFGTVVGGKSLIEGSIEARAQVTDTIGLVGFADAGLVGADSVPDFNEDVRIGVGAGLRYFTGLGPIRLDVAVPLDPRPGDPSVAFYVGIGQAF
ncbi:autotransporter assembly complex protein TamA [Mesorhizobium sp. YIM 152430]|uniref:autotransporter assembly complex protein TamA n=1 Tax=Mesorhizobium sp. YIM 152430 TaxID=3031761 RepID=UPI0023DAFB16|nr:autotransporter assembly complex family protein [Mesorhizobium sp. YIM 152430]MDF1599840.1 autotransporter assembly complex protein TamA [Mesorhizobium sp. YIM 152430]